VKQLLGRHGPAGQRVDHRGRLQQHLGIAAACHHAGEPPQEVDGFDNVIGWQ
jgi:hypothetical protein